MGKKKELAMFLVLALLFGSVSGLITGKSSWNLAAGAEVAAQTEEPSMPVATTTTAAATILPMPVTTPTTPIISEVKGGSKRVKIYWNKVNNADGYYIYYSTSLNGTYTKLKTITSGSTVKYVKKSLLQNQTYYFKISAYQGSGSAQVESALSAASSVTTAKVSATSTGAKQYSSKAKFKASNSYKKFSILKDANYTRTFVMPGAKNTNVAGFASTKMIPQAACQAGGYILISAYDKTGEDESVIYVINKSSKAYITTIVMPNKTKLNAMAYDGSRIWVTQKKKVSYFAYDVITQAVGSGNQFHELTAFADTLPILTTGSYMTYYNNILWVGAYNASATTNAYGYTIPETAGGKMELKQTLYMTMPNRTRAISFDANGYLYVTRSAKTNSSISGYISQVRTFLPSITTPTKKGGVKKNAVLKSTKLPPMAMGSAVYGNYIYHVYAGCQYAKCTYKVDRVVAVKLTKLQ